MMDRGTSPTPALLAADNTREPDLWYRSVYNATLGTGTGERRGWGWGITQSKPLPRRYTMCRKSSGLRLVLSPFIWGCLLGARAQADGDRIRGATARRDSQ
ncbi:hypothetical protein LIA77_01703 [Sarocladium implicatum]|nr:hypothetical protein LIA77_01703 [Sarocladium implicatum]